MRMRRLRMLPCVLGTLAFIGLGLVPEPLEAQTPFFPYFGKNRVKYDSPEWHIYKTDHFEIYFYPQLEPHLARIASYAESAYQTISAELKHDLTERVPLMLYKTNSEFQQQNISGDELPEGVLAFAEPERRRMVLPIDEPPDQLYRLITHELTHIFEFDIIPRGIVGGNLPLWVDEGLANFMARYWNILDLMQVRDAAITDSVPKISEFESAPLSGRLPYSLGHATFEFIESKWGKEGLRQFLFSLRKSVLGGGESAYEEALKVTPEDFDEQFDRYLKDRFKAFRDKERPADYGRNIAPNPQRTQFASVISIEPSPSGDILAAVVGNRRDYELDIVLISARDGAVITNLTKGFDKDRGFEYISTSGGLRGNLAPFIAWSPVGERIAYFARTEKSKTLIIQNHVSYKIERRIDLKSVDGPESPSFSPDGRKVAFSALRGAVTDIFTVDLDTQEVVNVTKDAIADYAPTFAPDGKSIVYAGRVAGNDKLFRVDLGSGEKKQLTFGAHDDTAAKFIDDHTLVFTSTASDPKVTLPEPVARNGNIPNVWTLDLNKNQLKQMTDTVTGNVSPVVIRSGSTPRIGFISYYKGENGIHIINGDRVVATAESDDFGTAAPLLDFTPPLSHTLVPDNIHKKGRFEKMSLAGRPPVGLGVTSGGNIYGNTQVTFTDVLGDKQMGFYAQSISQFRTMVFSYASSEQRLQYALQGFSQDMFYYGLYQNVLYDPQLSQYIDRDLAEAVQSQRGGTAHGIYPFNRYARLEGYTGYIHLSENYTNSTVQAAADEYQRSRGQDPLFRNGNMMPFGVSFVQETAVFREFGPVAGNAVKISYDASPAFGGNWISRQTLTVDARHYMRLAANGVFATRFKGLRSIGPNPDFMYFGGNSEMRGYDYLEFLGHKAFFANAELRFPLIEAMLTPLGVLGGLRGVAYFNIGAGGFNGRDYTVWTTKSLPYQPILGYEAIDELGGVRPIYGPTVNIDGFKLVDGRASYGIGLESSLLGFPMHFDWSWKTLFNEQWENAIFAAVGGSNQFRKVKFAFWIGYDF